MKASYKLIGASAMALALAFSGCNKKSEPSGASGGGESKTEQNRVDKSLVSEVVTRALLKDTSINGRKLIVGMIQANIERQGALGLVWPRTRLDPGVSGPSGDIASYKSKSATDYFNVLFDTGHQGTDEWDPFVDKDLLSTLGKTALDGKTLRAEGLDWCIAANVVDEMHDFMPILVSANFNPRLLLRSFSGKDDTRLPIGPASGAAKSMFGDSAIVIVRKSGAAEVIKAKDLTYGALYKNQAFDYSSWEIPLDYLTPTGIVEPVGHP